MGVIERKKLLAFLLIIVMIVSILPFGVYAGNNDTLPSNPSAGKGSTEWRYHENWEGIRISGYWAPSLDDFKNGTNLVRQIGETRDFTKTGPRYKIDEYTTYSIYRYMNGDDVGKGKAYKAEIDKINPYYFVGKEDSKIVASMPAVWNGSKKDWDEWFEGPFDSNGKPTYTNIPEIFRLLGTDVSAEDFKKGYLDMNGFKAKGVYKIFFEPIIFPTVDGKGMVLTLRDAIRWEEGFQAGDIKTKPIKNSSGNYYNPSLTMNLLPIFEYLANSQFLIEKEPALSMTANTTNYRVDGSTGSVAKRDEIRREIKKGGKIYSSMGVGVITGGLDNNTSNELQQVISFVKILGVNPDGSLILEQVEVDMRDVERNNDGTVRVQERIETEWGVALLNDVIASPVNLINSQTDLTRFDWSIDLPRVNDKSIRPRADYITHYLLNNYLSMFEAKISEYRISGNSRYDELKAIVDSYEETYKTYSVLKIKSQVTNYEMAEIDRLERELAKLINQGILLVDTTGNLNWSVFDDNVKLEIMRMQMRRENPTNLMILINQARFIDNLSRIDLDSGEIELEIEPFRSGLGSETVAFETAVNRASTTVIKPEVLYLRYILVPKSRQINIIKQYKDNSLVGVNVQVNDLVLNEVERGVYSASINDLSSNGLRVVEWVTSRAFQQPNNLPTTGVLKRGNTLVDIANFELGENLYVEWRQDLATSVANAGDVPEWRLSKYYHTLGVTNQAHMSLGLVASTGCLPPSLSPSGLYKYNTLNPNGQRTDANSNPATTKVNNWLHSKAIKPQSSYFISYSNPSVSVDLTGDKTLIKSTVDTGLRLANWIGTDTQRQELAAYDITSSNMGVAFAGDKNINKSTKVSYGLENIDRYTQTYSVYRHYTCTHYSLYGSWSHDVCNCYYQTTTVNPSYLKADFDITATFDRYKAENTDSRLLTISNSKVETNGKTTITKQETATLNVFPEVPMLFEDNKGVDSIRFVVGDLARKIRPISYHTMEYTAFITPKVVGTSVATDSRARTRATQIGLGNSPVIYKGSGLTTNFDVKRVEGSTDKGRLTVKTYALDIANNDLKSAWGNSGYNTDTINTNFLNSWTFRGTATHKLEVAVPNGTNVAYTGPEVRNPLEYTRRGNTTTTNHALTIRGGVVTHVGGTAIATVRTSNPALYEALENMRLVGPNRDQTVLATFEHQRGDALTEQRFVDQAALVRNGINNLAVGRGWYSEDTTVLVVREYTTLYDLPISMFTDKIPMTIKGLETPANKQNFFNTMSLGYTILNYTIESSDMGAGLGRVKSIMEHNSRVGGSFGRVTRDYGVPNVTVNDTIGF